MSDMQPTAPPAKTSAETVQAQKAGSAGINPEGAHSSVKVYDRPERTGLSPTLLLIVLIVLAILAFILYRIFVH